MKHSVRDGLRTEREASAELNVVSFLKKKARVWTKKLALKSCVFNESMYLQPPIISRIFLMQCSWKKLQVASQLIRLWSPGVPTIAAYFFSFWAKSVEYSLMAAAVFHSSSL